MKIEDYEKARNLIKSKNQLNDLWQIFCKPYPNITYHIKKFLFWTDIGNIDLYQMDKQTQEELRNAIRNIISKRIKEIENEIEAL